MIFGIGQASSAASIKELVVMFWHRPLLFATKILVDAPLFLRPFVRAGSLFYAETGKKVRRLLLIFRHVADLRGERRHGPAPPPMNQSRFDWGGRRAEKSAGKGARARIPDAISHGGA
jgi:hypothetical protein